MSRSPRKLHVNIGVITEMHDSKVVPFILKYTCFCISVTEIHETKDLL